MFMSLSLDGSFLFHSSLSIIIVAIALLTINILNNRTLPSNVRSIIKKLN
jgi:hypothetical protein